MNARGRNNPLDLPLRTALAYAIVGALWILLSDQALRMIVQDPVTAQKYEVYKGWAFIAVTAMALFLVLRSQLSRWEREASARQKAEEDLRERETQYRAVIETSADGFLMLDMTGRILEANDAYARRSGYSREELLALTISDFEVFETPEETRQRIERIRREGLDLFETLHRTRDGTLWQAEADVSYWPISGGRLFVFVRDINQRKRSQSLLRTRVELSRLAEQSSLEALLQNALDRIEIFTGSRISCFHFVEPSDRRITLQACSTSTHRWMKADIHDEQNPLNRSQTLPRCLESKAPIIENDASALSDRLERLLTVPVVRQQTVTAIVCVANKSFDYTDEDASAVQEISCAIMDLVERKRAEEAVHRSEERYRAIVETSFDWIWEVDSEGRFTFSSPRVADLLGYSPAEVIGRTPFDFMPRTEAEHARAVFMEARAARRPFAAMEKAFLHRDGRSVILESSGVPVLGPDRTLRGYRGSDRNITERKLAEKERQALEAQLRQAQKMEAIGTLAGGVAHDFNNILTVIHGNASLLLHPQLKPLEKNECAEQIVRAAERAAGLTRQLLMFSRKQVMQLSSVHLNEIVGNMTKMLQRILGEDIALQTRYAPNIGLTHADAGMIEQVLLNLVVNARDAMPQGGQLKITTGATVFDEVEARSWADATPGHYVWVEITDNGTGIAPENLPRIFEPFFTTKEVGKGTGLGLATAYGIVKQHHGWITVQSDLNRGTTFRIHFPAQPGASPRTAAETRPTELPRGSETILVVEDDPAVRDLMITLLQRCGYRVLDAQSGRSALDLWNANRADIDLLLTDVVMPDGMTGLDLADQLLGDRPSLKVLYVTGYSADLAGKRASLVEGVNFLQKPFSPDSLARALRTLLQPGG